MAIGLARADQRDRRRAGLRFPVLAHWSFTTTEGATFEYLMQNLDYGLLGTLEGEHLPRDADLPLPRPPSGADPPPRPVTTKVLETGHVELGHRTRRGDASEAWYRGPLVPHPTTRDQPVDGVAAARAQRRPAAPHRARRPRGPLATPAAFEIGRLLALSQLSVVSALLRFRRRAVRRASGCAESSTPFVPFNGPAGRRRRVDLGRLVVVHR